MRTISKDGTRLTVNCGADYQNWSQRKNRYALKTPDGLELLGPGSMCNVTSYIHVSECSGWRFPSGPYDRPPDNFADFLVSSSEVDEEYERKFPALHEDWRKLVKGEYDRKKFVDINAAKAGTYSPLELHELLSFGFNLWVQCSDASRFSASAHILKEIVKELVIEERPMVASCTVVGLGHIVALMGLEYDLLDEEAVYTGGMVDQKTRNIVETKSFRRRNEAEGESFVQRFLWDAANPTDDLVIYPSSVIIDDPYGMQPSSRNELKRYAANSPGEDNFIDYRADYVEKYKPLGNSKFKYAHFFKKGARSS